MKEKNSKPLNKIWHEKRIAIISSTIAVLMIIIGLSTWLTLYNENVTVAVWITTSGTIIGAFIGASLAGYISTRNVKEQINTEKKRQDEQKMKTMENVLQDVLENLESIIIAYEKILDYLQADNLRLIHLERETKVINYFFKELEKSNAHIFSNETYKLINEVNLDITNRLFDFEFQAEEIMFHSENKGLSRRDKFLVLNSEGGRFLKDKLKNSKKLLEENSNKINENVSGEIIDIYSFHQSIGGR